MPPLSPFSKSCIAVAIAQSFSMQAVHAATITVDSLADVVDSNAPCTLREAITNTNAGTDQTNGCVITGSLGVSDTIYFDQSLVDGSITLNASHLSITEDVGIFGSNITIDANSNSRAVYINGSMVSLNDLTIINGSESLGGGIFATASSVSLSNCTVSGNSVTSRGGGIFAISGTTISMNNSILSGNSATSRGAAIYAFSGNTNINNSTLSGNSANGPGGAIAVTSGNIVSLINSTVSGNSGSLGGGFYVVTSSNSSINLNNSTVTDNSATNYGGGIMNQATNNFSLSNTIVSGNSASVSSEIHNNGTIIANNSNLFGHIGLTDALAFDNFTPGVNDLKATSDGTSVSLSNILNPLVDNGGNTLTHALVVDSPAVDASGAGATATDQRGFNTISTRDIGAFEFGSVVGLDLTVNSDLDDNGSGCTLREAIATTNALSNLSNGCFNIGTPGDPSIINFDNTLNNGTITLSNGQLNITQDVAVNGLNNTINASLTSRVMYIDDSTVSLNSLTITNGSAYIGGGINAKNSSVSLNNITLTGNSAFAFGGGISAFSSSINLSNSTVSGNSSNRGGGFNAFASSNINLSSSIVSGNSAATNGGGIYVQSSSVSLNNSTISDNSATTNGGGITSTGTSSVTLNNTTVSGNSAVIGGGIESNSSSKVFLNNSTVSGNLARGGGGIALLASSSLTLNNSTVSGNSAGASGGIYSYSNSSVTLNNSIVSNNTASYYNEIASYSSNSITTNGNNLFGHSGLSNADAFYIFTPNVNDINATSDDDNIPIASILDTTLADNGGLTLTHALPVGSPAIDAGDDAACTAAPINNLDQRGEIRPIGAHCDIGSFEAEESGGFIVIPLPGNKAVVIPSG